MWYVQGEEKCVQGFGGETLKRSLVRPRRNIYIYIG